MPNKNKVMLKEKPQPRLVVDKTEPRLIQDETDEFLLQQVEELKTDLVKQVRIRRRNDMWQSVAILAVLVIESILLYNFYA